MNGPLNSTAIYDEVIAELRRQRISFDFNTPSDLASRVGIAQTRWLDTRESTGDTKTPRVFVFEEIRAQVAALKQLAEV
jgi:hypothetical protein